ncbi:MAG: TIGR00730 family Rossman fold protein [Minisyncoccota bacterium]
MNDEELVRKKQEFQTLTKKEMHIAARERISVISQEFKDGFRFLEKLPKSVTFFGGARFPEDHYLYKQAQSLALRIAKETGYAVITGGGPGIMEGANRGAFEGKVESAGLTIQLPHEQAINPYLTKHLDFYYFFSRKVCLSFATETYIFFPGGFGTLDEFFEILTLVQTHKIEKVPIILVGKEFWDGVQEMIVKELLSRETITSSDLDLYTITDSEDEIIEIIKNAPIRNGVPLGYKKSQSTSDTALKDKSCVPCEGNTTPLTHDESKDFIDQVDRWILVDDVLIEKTIYFRNFGEAMHFVNKVANIAESENHHPNIYIFDYSKVKLTLTTHAIKGLSDNDFILAAKIDELLR